MVIEQRRRANGGRSQLTRKEKEVLKLRVKKIGQLVEQQTQIEFEKDKKEKKGRRESKEEHTSVGASQSQNTITSSVC